MKMNEFSASERARLAEYRNRPKRRSALWSRPDRFALLAVAMAVLAMIAGAASADASNGGVGTGAASSDKGSRNSSSGNRYDRSWRKAPRRQKRWARATSECESGGNPRAIGGGGRYRGAFQFMRQTWRAAPKSPGGDPIRYNWRTQAVVALALKRKEGSRPWPVCGKASTRP